MEVVLNNYEILQCHGMSARKNLMNLTRNTPTVDTYPSLHNLGRHLFYNNNSAVRSLRLNYSETITQTVE